MRYFVAKDSIVREIWGKSDTVLFIFAGAAAEFALNKAVDWLYFTGKLPADPLGRLFSTVGYAHKIILSPEDDALKAIDVLRKIHGTVEQNRGAVIPDWAYRDVLFLLVHYSIAAYELLERKLSATEKEEVYHVFYRVGDRMGLKGLPNSYTAWLPVRALHLDENLEKSHHTANLCKQYKKHLGAIRFEVLMQSQKLLVPDRVKKLLQLDGLALLSPAIPLYKASRRVGLDHIFKNLLLPSAYKAQIKALDVQTNTKKCPWKF